MDKRTILKLLLFVGLSFVSATYANNKQYHDGFRKLFDIIDYIYVEEPDKNKMLDSAAEGMLTSLDPHSTYLTDDDLKDFQEQTDGSINGIGVEIIYDVKTKSIKVITPLDDMPAAKAGIEAGDMIVEVGSEKVSDMTFSQSLRKIKGPKNTKVKISVIKNSDQSIKEYEITRTPLKTHRIKYHMDNDIGYLRISSFNKNTFDDFKNATDELFNNSKPSKALILDLRNNPGGLLDQAVLITQAFLYGNADIVHIKSRLSNNTTSIPSDEKSYKIPNVPIVVLINHGSASAAEIVAGALQDHKRAIIMGTKSFGKGSVQSLIPLDKRSAIKVTTSRYYTPNDRSIQAVGIEPDIIVEPAKIEPIKEIEYSESMLKNHLSANEDKNKKENKAAKDRKQDKKLKKPDFYNKDYLYTRACDLLNSWDIFKNNK